jgi:hypothetical protein
MTITTQEALKQQQEQAERERRERKAELIDGKFAAPAVRTTNGGTAVAIPRSGTAVATYLDEIASSGIVGRMIKFDKNGEFVTPDDDVKISEDTDFIVLADQTLIGWIKFNVDAPPSRAAGLLYDGFIMPSRDSLGDMDESQWPVGLNGRPEDPWKHQICLVLQHGGTSELYTFVTTSVTGRRAIGNLLRHYDRMLRTNPGELPVIKLKKGGFNHRDERVGWVSTPAFAVCGRAPRDSVAKPDTSPSADMNDEVPF